jgi:hypothetical protein
MRHGVEHTEDAKVLRNGEVAGEGSVDGGKVRAAEGLAAPFGKVAAVDGDGSRGGFEDAQDHVDGGGFASAVGAEEAEDFMRADLEGEAVDSDDVAVLLAQMAYGKDGSGHREVQRSAVSVQKNSSPSWPRPGIGARPVG